MWPKNWAANYTATILNANDTAFVLKLIPGNKEDVYSKLIVTVNKRHYFPEKIVYYNTQGKAVKQAYYQYEKIGNLWNARIVSMTNLLKNHTTRIISSNVRLNQGLKDSEFTVEQLASHSKRKNKK